MLSIKVVVTNLDASEERLTKIGLALKDMTDILAPLGETLKAFFEDTNFVSEGRAIGEAWQELATTTASEKNKSWPGRGILERTGTLRHSFESTVEPMRLVVRNTAKTKDGRSLAAIHQDGTNRAGRGNHVTIPARKLVGINDTVETIVKSAIEVGVRAKIDGTL